MQIDDRLVARFRAGETQAFDELMVIHTDRLFALAFEILRHREDAEEVTQEVFIKLYNQISGSRPPTCLRPWLYRVCLNICIDRKRSKKRQPVFLEFTEANGSLRTEDASEKVIASVFHDTVEAALNDLPAQQKMAFALCHFAGLSVDEIGESLNCAPATVRVHLSRATLRLRESLSKEKMENECL